MTEEHDHPELEERLGRIETHLRHVKLLLLLLIVICLLGLPGVLQYGVRGLLLGGACLALAYLFFFLVDHLLLRRGRERREAAMSEKLAFVASEYQARKADSDQMGENEEESRA